MDANRELEEDKGYIDEEGVFHGLDQDEKLFKDNERLLQRLTKVATKDSVFKNGDMSDHNLTHDQTTHTEHILDIQGGGNQADV